MAKARSARSGLTARDRFWLEHLRRVEREGIGSKAYARERGLSVHALYQARKRLIGLGAWPERRVAPAAAPPVFTPVRVVEAPVAETAAFRVRLAGGGVLEWSTTPAAETLTVLLDRLAAAR